MIHKRPILTIPKLLLKSKILTMTNNWSETLSPTNAYIHTYLNPSSFWSNTRELRHYLLLTNFHRSNFLPRHKHSLVRDWKNAVSSFFIQCLQLHQFAEFRWNVATQKIVGEDSVMTKQLRSRQKKVRLWSYHHGSPFLHNHDLINLQTTTRECDW